MFDEIFILIIFLALSLTFRWAFRTLPYEQWQIISCFPYKKLSNGSWLGWNLTWYGFFNAIAILFAVSILIILLGAVSTPIIACLFILTMLLLICLPAAKILAFLIEKKQNTYTVGGASFIGILTVPCIVFLIKLAGDNLFDFKISVIAILSAMSIAYAFGEGFGRLACVSFGCCYGKPLKELSPFFQNIFRRYNFIFIGKAKKIAYAHGLDGQQVIPIQAVTTLIYSLIGIIGCYLFLKGFIASAFILTLTVTQIWRFLSEFLRADYRGKGTISAYQIMALSSCLYGLVVAYIFHETQRHKPDLVLGLSSLWNPALLLFLMALWIVTFFYTGKSKITAALIDIKVNEKI
jgi:hypothetical protein